MQIISPKVLVPVALLVFQVAAILYARTVTTRYFCWAPYDTQTEYTATAVVNGHELTAAETDVVGILGLVTGPIRVDGTGEIQFSQNGSRRFAHARSEAGVALARGTEVVVMRYERGVAYVRRWDEVSGGESLSTEMKRAHT